MPVDPGGVGRGDLSLLYPSVILGQDADGGLRGRLLWGGV